MRAPRLAPVRDGLRASFARTKADTSASWKAKVIAGGRCVNCGDPRGEMGTMRYCRPCADKRAAQAREKTYRGPMCQWPGCRKIARKKWCEAHSLAADMQRRRKWSNQLAALNAGIPDPEYPPAAEPEVTTEDILHGMALTLLAGGHPWR